MRKRSVGMEVAHTAQNWRKADRLSGSRGSFSFSNQRNRRGFGGGFWGRILAFPGICVRQEKKLSIGQRNGLATRHVQSRPAQLNGD